MKAVIRTILISLIASAVMTITAFADAPVITVEKGNPSKPTLPPYKIQFMITDQMGVETVTVNGQELKANGRAKCSLVWSVNTNKTVTVVAKNVKGEQSKAEITITNLVVDDKKELTGIDRLYDVALKKAEGMTLSIPRVPDITNLLAYAYNTGTNGGMIFQKEEKPELIEVSDPAETDLADPLTEPETVPAESVQETEPETTGQVETSPAETTEAEAVQPEIVVEETTETYKEETKEEEEMQGSELVNYLVSSDRPGLATAEWILVALLSLFVIYNLIVIIRNCKRVKVYKAYIKLMDLLKRMEANK